MTTFATMPGTAAPSAASPLLTDRLTALFDAAVAEINSARCVEAVRLFGSPMSALWAEGRAMGRDDEMLALARSHPLQALVQQDPFTWRAFHKPRGYAGDAVMLDLVYRGEPPAATTTVGRSIFAATTRSRMSLSVRYRRVLLRSCIDDVVSGTNGGRILSVASGHCRELEGSLVASAAFNGEFVALDQDPLSCAEVTACTEGQRVRVIEQGVRELVSRGGSALGQFDLIYSAGLYDYLPDALARRLTERLLAMLAPGGRLLLANFVPTGSERGYMEMFMDWRLILRNEAALRELCTAAGARHITSFHDPHRNVVYAEATVS